MKEAGRQEEQEGGSGGLHTSLTARSCEWATMMFEEIRNDHAGRAPYTGAVKHCTGAAR
jgi:hypothetical protein